MDKPPKTYHRQPIAETVALIYLLVGVLWIALSDKAVAAFISDPDVWTIAQTYKGWFYVLTTALLLYVSLKYICGVIARTNEDLVQSSDQLRLIFDQAEDGIALLRTDMTIVDCNPSLCRIYGVESKATLIGRSVLEFTTERLRNGRLATEMVEELLQKVMKDEALQFYWRHEQPSGAVRDVEVSGKLIRLGGKPFIQAIVRDVTERFSLEDELRKVNAQLQYIIDNTQDIIFQIDLHGNYIYGNAAVEVVSGYTVEEVLKKNMLEVIVPEHISMVQERLQKRVAGDHEPGSYSFQIFHKDGHRIWLELMTSGVYDAEGRLIAVQGIARDISDRKGMEEALEKRIFSLTRPLGSSGDITFDELFNLDQIQRIQDEFADATGVASIITNPAGDPITQGSNGTRLCGEIIKKSEKGRQNCIQSDRNLSRYHPEGPVVQPCRSCGLWDAGVNIVVGGRHVATWLVGQVRSETQKEESMRAYARQIEVDEEVFVQAFREVPVMSKGRFEQVANALYSLANQISNSAYMNLQQARFIADEKKRTAELRRLSTAINQSAESVLITDAAGIIQYANPAFEQATGYRQEEVVGKNPSLLKSGVHTKSFYRDLWACISSGETWKGQMHNCRKDGTVFVEDATISPILNEAGEIVSYVGLKRDITRELSLEEQFRQAQKMEAIGRLASGVAHDFNNILQTILGYCGVLMMETEGQHEIQQDVKEIQNSAKRAGQLTRQLLTFSRRQPALQAQVDLNQVLTEQISMLRRLVGENISLCFDPAEHLFPIKADHSQIEQVVMNLVVNARDAMPEGGTITLRTRNIVYEDEVPVSGDRARGREYVCMTVRDNGTGMKKEVLDHLFEPFFTTKSVGEGTGLGLAIIYGIVDQHSGWIDVDSKVDEGSTFSIYLPRCTDQMESDSETEGTLFSVPQGSEDRRKKILLVEDDEQVRKLSRMILSEAGYAVTDSDCAEHAEALLREQPEAFDLLLIDAVLPDRPGIELAEELCASNAESAVIIFSGYSDARVRVDKIEQKGYEFLRKPFSTESLLQMVKTTLKNKSNGTR